MILTNHSDSKRYDDDDKNEGAEEEISLFEPTQTMSHLFRRDVFQ